MKRISKQFAGRFVIAMLAVFTLAFSVPLTTSAAQPSWNNTGVTCTYYRVKRGDTLSRISVRYGVAIWRIQQANGLRSTRIYTNTTLCIPRVTYTPPPPPPQPRVPPCYWGCRPPLPRVPPCYWGCAPQYNTSWQAEIFQGLDTVNGPLMVTVPGFSNASSFYWWNGSPYPGVPGGGWSIRLTRYVYLNGGTYNFSAGSDNGVIVWVDQTQVINNWSASPVWTAYGSGSFGAGQHLITVAYRHPGGPAQLSVNWSPWQ